MLKILELSKKVVALYNLKNKKQMAKKKEATENTAQLEIGAPKETLGHRKYTGIQFSSEQVDYLKIWEIKNKESMSVLVSKLLSEHMTKNP
jgi:hypothetical protein